MSLINFGPVFALTDDDAQFRKDLLMTYIQSFEAFPATLAAALRSQNPDQVQFAIHRVKATVRMLQAVEVERVLEDLMQKTEKAPFDAQEMDRLSIKIAQLFEAMNGEISACL